MEQDKQKNVIDIDDIILEEPIHKIEELNIDTLNQFSAHFRASYKNMEREMASSKHQQPEVNVFYENIVKLIGKIQPSKAALSFVLIEVEEILQQYYGDILKIDLRSTAKSKNIFAMDYLMPAQQREMFVEVKGSIDQIKRCLMLRESQLGMVIYIEDNAKQYPPEQFAKMYEQYFQEIKEYVIPIEKCFMPINYPLLSQILQNQSLYYEQFGNKATVLQDEIMAYSKQLRSNETITWTQKFSTQKNIKLLKILSSKISTIADLFSFACIKSQQDLFSKKKTDERWKKLFEKEIITYKLYGDSATVHKSFDKLKANLNVINAAMNILSQSGELSGIKKLTKKWEAAGKVLKVALFKENALHEAEVMISNPSEVLAKEIWNLPERAQFKKFIELGLPSIEFSTRLFIPRVAKDYFYGKLRQDYGVLPNFHIDNPSQYYNDLQIEQKDKVSIRINHSFKLLLKEFKTQQKQSNIFKHTLSEMGKKIQTGVETLKSNFKKMMNQVPKEVIFHIHGGGFISMSSFIHQAYTRNWANNLKVPIVSVDYGKAPEHPYPEGLADCLEAYLWTMHCMRQIYEFQPEKIILVGDSAGGNLVAALTNVLIKWNLRKPDGIVMVYPALNLNYFDYSPSLLTALNDMILPHTFLKICLRSYLKDKSAKPDEDYLVSPILTPNDILKKYPQTRMFVGSKDPFHDDCCRFAQKLSLIDPQRVHLMIFEEFPHGFLQFDMKNQPHYFCKQATKQVEQSLKYLLISKPIQF